MVKQRKKKHKKHYPPLAKVDKLIFKGIGTLLFTFGLIFVLASTSHFMYIKYLTGNTLAVDNSIIIFIIPFALFVFPLSIILYSNEKPLFGNKDVNYFDLQKYKKTLPIFDKRYINKKAVAAFSIKTAIVILIAISLAIVLKFSFTQRYELTENGIYHYNIHNEQVETIDYDNVTSYKIITSQQYGKRSLRSAQLYIMLEFDNKNLTFDFNQFRDVYALKTADDLLKEQNKSFDSSRLDRFIEIESFNEQEEQIIRGLFT
ncbi:MAG: hypothetical protein NC122_03855 [Faecalibacterium sp.]|nr:hypothetical protein [Ruminococcus sp.]MCM1392774.1 hypothetical protein [Ruminococcus sp.]MCM1485320.1 hypothetical protein [Faecalibacterium sp.]